MTDLSQIPRNERGIGFLIDRGKGDFIEFRVGRKLTPKQWESVKKIMDLIEESVVEVADPETIRELKLHS